MEEQIRRDRASLAKEWDSERRWMSDRISLRRTQQEAARMRAPSFQISRAPRLVCHPVLRRALSPCLPREMINLELVAAAEVQALGMAREEAVPSAAPALERQRAESGMVRSCPPRMAFLARADRAVRGASRRARRQFAELTSAAGAEL